MSCYGIQYANGEKVIFPIHDEKNFRLLRDTPHNKEMFRKAKEGNREAKMRLAQMAFNIVGAPNQKLKETCMYGNSFFFDYDDPDSREDFIQKCLDRQEEVGLLLLERSVHGAHAVFRREMGQTILENQARIASLLDCEWDNQTKDAQRIVFCSPSEEVLFVHPDLFLNTVEDEEVAKREYLDLQEKATREHAPRDKHASPRAGRKATSDVSPCAGRPAHALGEESASGDSPCSEQPAHAPSDDSPHMEPAHALPAHALGEEATSDESRCDGRPAQEKEGVDYAAILPKFFQMENPAYPHIVEGMRNDTVFNVCAKYLRYCCDHNFEKMMELVFPDFSFGLPEREVEGIIRSALSRERGLTPKVVKRLVMGNEGGVSAEEKEAVRTMQEMYGMEGTAEGEEVDASLSFEGIYPSVEDCIADELLMPRLPKFLDIALKCVPVGQKFVALGATVPALMTLLTNCSCKFGTKAVSRLNGWSHVDGPPASGKNLICKPIELLLTPIKEQDDRNTELINRVADNRRNNPNAENMAPIPKLGIRLLVPDTTRKAHIMAMHLLDSQHTYTLAPELSSLRMRGYYDRMDFCRLLFDNGVVGTNTNMDNSPKVSTPCNWNVTTSSTRDQTLNFWKNVTDGSVTRVLYLLMPDTTFSEMPKYVQYTQEEKDYVVRASRVMMQLGGLAKTSRAGNALEDWLHQVLCETKVERDGIRAMLRKRSADIAFFFASTIHLCFCAQQILDEEDALRAKEAALKQRLNELQSELSPDQESIKEVQNRLIEHQQKVAAWKSREFDLSRFSEKEAVAQMARYVADYNLDTQYQLWGEKMRAQLNHAYQGITRKGKKDDRYDRAPETFTILELQNIFTEMNLSAVRKMVSRWMDSRLIEKIHTQDREATYRKT